MPEENIRYAFRDFADSTAKYVREKSQLNATSHDEKQKKKKEKKKRSSTERGQDNNEKTSATDFSTYTTSEFTDSEHTIQKINSHFRNDSNDNRIDTSLIAATVHDDGRSDSNARRKSIYFNPVDAVSSRDNIGNEACAMCGAAVDPDTGKARPPLKTGCKKLCRKILGFFCPCCVKRDGPPLRGRVH